MQGILVLRSTVISLSQKYGVNHMRKYTSD